MSLTTKVLLNRTRQKDDGTYPLVVRMTYDRQVIYIPVGYSLNEKDWDAKNQRIRSGSDVATNITRINKIINKRTSRIYDVVAELEDKGEILGLSIKDIKKRIVSGSNKSQINVFDFIKSIIDEMIRARQIGNSEIYRALLNKLKKFHALDNLTFEEINYSFLKRFEAAHFANKNEPGGLSVYLRTLRAVCNRAVKTGYLSPEKYPFKDYKIKNGDPRRRSLTQEEFESLKSVDLETRPSLSEARKLFMASFYMRGMNWMDMGLLRLSNIQGDFDRIQYARSKTNKRFSIRITDRLKEIILSYANPNGSKDDFIFPILNKEDPENRYHKIIKNKRNSLNKRLKRIATLCNSEPFSIYTARHTYATMGKRKGVPTAVIQESLGHKTESTTQTYLDSFDNKVVDDFDELIMGD